MEKGKKCEERRNATDGSLQKNLTITVEPTAKTDDRLKATFIVAIGYLVITIVCFIGSGVLFKFDLKGRSSRRPAPKSRRRWRVMTSGAMMDIVLAEVVEGS